MQDCQEKSFAQLEHVCRMRTAEGRRAKKRPAFLVEGRAQRMGGFLLSMPPRRGGGGSPAAAAAAAVSVLRVVPEERGDGDINGIGSVGPGGQRVDAGVVVPAGIAAAAIAAALIVTTTHKRNPQSIGLQGECLPTDQYMLLQAVLRQSRRCHFERLLRGFPIRQTDVKPVRLQLVD